MNELRFAILGPGKISHRFVKGFQYTKGATLYAVASRDYKKAKEYATQYDISKAYGGYEEMLNDDLVDVVYIATPTQVHFEQVMLCLKHGKHVICEKPFMVNSNQAIEAFAYSKEKNLFLMEAMKAVFLPTTKQAKEWIEKGKIGKIKYIEASYCYDGKFPKDHWVYRKEYGGGGMYDVGVYAVAYVQSIINETCIEQTKMTILNEIGSDDFTQILMKFDSGCVASVRGAIGVQTKNIATIYGDLGYIECPLFWKANEVKLYEYESNKEECTVFHIDQPSEFTYQIQEVIDCVHLGKIESDIMSSSKSIDLLKTIE